MPKCNTSDTSERKLKETNVLIYFLPVAAPPLGLVLLSGLLVPFPGVPVDLVLALLLLQLLLLGVFLLHLLVLLLRGLLGFLLLLDSNSFIVYLPVLKFTVLSLERNKKRYFNLLFTFPWRELNP
jgi:hypothetical protein